MTSTLLFPELAPPPMLDFPQPLSEKYRPARIAEFAGLAAVKDELAGFVTGPRDIGFLFIGGAGTGKTSMGLALANETRSFVYHIRSGCCTVDAVERTAFSAHYMPPAGYKRNLILIDEMDLASLPAQNICLSYLDGMATIPQTTWVFTCNGTDRLAERFTSRCRVLPFPTYSIQADAAELLKRVWKAETDAPCPNMAGIIKAQKGNIRAALSTLDSRLDALRAYPNTQATESEGNA
jgi:replication-associated recombination protein RarA